MSMLDIAQARKGKARDGVGKAKAGVSQAGTKVEYGTATSASADGYVEIIMDNGGSSFTVPCDSPINQGDRVSYISHAGQGKAVSLYGTTALAQQAYDNADDAAQAASDAAQAASDASDEAQAAMAAIDQHFWSDSDGVHVTEVTQDGWNDSSSSDYHRGKNILLNSLGVILRNALAYLAQFTASGVTFFDGSGTSADHQTAQFTSTTARVGMLSQKHVTMNSNGISIADGDYTQARFNGGSIAFYDGQGNNADNITAQFGGSGARIGSSSTASVTLSQNGLIIADGSGATISEMVNSGTIYGDRATTSENAYGVAGGSKTITMGVLFTSGDTLSVWFSGNPWGMSDAITMTAGTSYTTAVDIYAYPGGTRTKVGTLTKNANDQFTVSYTVPLQGQITVEYSVASYEAPYFTFGTRSYTAKGPFSTVLGLALRAVNACTTAIGRYNLNFDGPLVVGNGTDNANRSNAMTVGWDGTVTLGTPLPVASGGTGATGVSSATTGASVITVASGVTLQSATYRTWGKMAQVLIGVRVSSSLAANATVTIGTIVSGKRPVMATQCGYISNDGYISTDGSVVIRNITGASIGTSTTIYTAATYLLA